MNWCKFFCDNPCRAIETFFLWVFFWFSTHLLPMQLTSSNSGSFHRSRSDLDGTGTRSRSTTDDKLDALFQNFYTSTDRANSRHHDLDARCGFTYHENAWWLCDQTYRDETEFQHLRCTPVQSRDRCCNSFKYIRFGKILTFARSSCRLHSRWPHGPESSSDNRNTRRRLDISLNPDDEHMRSAVLLRFPWLQSGSVISEKIDTIHCKASSMSVRLVLESRNKC